MVDQGWRIGVHDWVRRWWRGETGAAARVLDPVLWPAEQLYRLVTGARNGAYDAGVLPVAAPPIRVVSIGNLGVGGAGKTPVAAWIASLLSSWGHRPAIVMRGYGDDETRLHQEWNPGVPVVVARRRVQGVAEAARQGCDVAVVDDGFQHRAMGRHLDLVLVSADAWSERRRLLPRGPWREGVAALRRASLVLITRKAVGADASRRVAGELASVFPRERVVLCRIAAASLAPLGGGAPLPVEHLRGRDVLAVASLADPAPFARNLRTAGSTVELVSFPDHHPYGSRDVAAIVERARGRPVVMTRKDAVKLRSLLPARLPAFVLDQRVEIEDGRAVLEASLREALAT